MYRKTKRRAEKKVISIWPKLILRWWWRGGGLTTNSWIYVDIEQYKLKTKIKHFDTRSIVQVIGVINRPIV